MRLAHILLCTGLVSALAACGGNDRLHRFNEISGGPEEFRALPARPLEMPQSMAVLPPPASGANLADQHPKADAVAALGGSPSALVAGDLPASDAALVAAVSQAGTRVGIRALLAQEDAAFRARRGRISTGGLGGSDPYFAAYSAQALDAAAEAARFRAAGLPTPSAPPAE
ncbi:Beta-barrel assembly machine subunit BamF [Poseidonocella pacifica]|uniref:Beta-barrel assembly machine subunit BamF n=1 Tax=Poseidonocella pacifica TaxID=871651 RepID=A0A1I0XN24_9RHOB|nr:DUF3035 domain-containing protein [Poseidonocella pacifica]SFB01373.1 Beta-barrel assembly machine subunit BamF [Poseidonocella pacifica]